jgi:protein O-mannosyl-transferase
VGRTLSGPPAERHKARPTRATVDAREQTTRIRWRAAVIVLAGVLVYANSLSSPFLFDDVNSILTNTQIRRLWPLSVPLSPPRDTPVAGRPLVNLTFAINYAAGGLDPWGYHVVNVLIHVMAALVLFGLVRRTLEGSSALNASRYRPSPTASIDVALVCALVWLLHPLNSESVNYFSQRTESMMGLFFLLTLYCSARGWNGRAVLACALGMACKESMLTAPVVVVLYDRVFVYESWKRMLRRRRGFYISLAATWLVVAALMSSAPRSTVGFGAGTDPVMYLWNQFQMIARYLQLAFWPRDLVLDYGLPRPLAFGDVAAQAALVVGLGVATIIALVRWPLVGFFGAWFFITLAPTSSIVPIATEVGAERRMYLPLMSIVVLVVVGGRALIEFVADRKGSLDAARTLTVRGAAGVVCLLLAFGTIARNREYQSPMSIARTIVDRWPNGRGHYLLGTELLKAGQRDGGMSELRVSAVDYPGARYALGTELLAEGMVDQAIDQLQMFIAALPNHANVAPARDMLGRAYAAQGRFDLATEQLERLLKEYPAYPAASQVRALLVQIRNARFGRS